MIRPRTSSGGTFSVPSGFVFMPISHSYSSLYAGRKRTSYELTTVLDRPSARPASGGREGVFSVHDWAEVHRLFHREQLSKSAIAKRLGMTRHTVARLLARAQPPR